MSNIMSLPEEIQRGFLYPTKEIHLDDYASMIIKDKTIKTEDGTAYLSNIHNTLNLICQHDIVFTIGLMSQTDSILRGLNYKQLIELNYWGETQYEHWNIKRTKNSYKINDTYIFNVSGFTKQYYTDTTLEELIKITQDITNSRKEMFSYPLFSPATEARSIALSNEEIFEESLYARKLSLSKIDLFNLACHGGRMESAGLGTSTQYHYDMNKAHMRLLSEYPGLVSTNIARGKTKLLDSALPNSIYKIKVEIPHNKFKFNPLPLKTEAGVIYPSGTIISWYYKDYIHLLEDLNIPFKILDSLQVIGPPSYPYKDHMTLLKAYSIYLEHKYPTLGHKYLYATLAGSTKAIYNETDKKLKTKAKSIRGFNPAVYGFVLARQNTQIYRESLKHDTLAIKMDSIAINKETECPENFRLETSGKTTYLTPYLKTLPEEEKKLCTKAIRRSKDKKHAVYLTRTWLGLSSFLLNTNTNLKLGQEYIYKQNIKPNYGNRTGPKINNIDTLLSTWMMSRPSNKIPESPITTSLQTTKRLNMFNATS